MIKLYQHIIIIALGVFLFSCEQEQITKSQDQNSEIVLEVDPEFLTEQASQNGRTAASTVALNRIRVYLQRDQWAGGQYRMVITDEESGRVVVRSGYGSVIDLPISNQLNGFRTVSFSPGNVAVKKGVKHKIRLEFTHAHHDFGYVYAAASIGNAYAPGCSHTCLNDWAFETTNRRSDGMNYTDQVQALKQTTQIVNSIVVVGQEFVPQDFP